MSRFWLGDDPQNYVDVDDILEEEEYLDRQKSLRVAKLKLPAIDPRVSNINFDEDPSSGEEP